MTYQTRPADPRLARPVSHLGYSDAALPAGRELALPTGTPQLLVRVPGGRLTAYGLDGAQAVQTAGGGAALAGPADRPSVIDPSEQNGIVWVAFRPGGAYPFFPVGGADVRNRLVDLADLWGSAAACSAQERIASAADPWAILRAVETVLLERAAHPPVLDLATGRAVAALNAGTPVAAAAEALGWTPRRLARTITAQVGLSPKRFGRVRRFQRLLAAAGDAAAGDAAAGDAAASGARPEPDWARLAAETGYYDQAHMINDFRALSGLTPGTYRPRARMRNHVRRD